MDDIRAREIFYIGTGGADKREWNNLRTDPQL